jgi:hypothetical protein
MSERTTVSDEPRSRRRRTFDWLFEATCTVVFLVLLGAAVQAGWVALH